MQRKVAYSGKKKKLQLKERKARKASQPYWLDDDAPMRKPAVNTEIKDHFVASTSSIPHPETTSFGMDTLLQEKKLVSAFEKLSPETIRIARLDSMKPFQRLPNTCLELSVEQCQPAIDFPKRPAWSYDITKEQLELQEKRAFDQWKMSLYETYGQSGQLSWFEQNLEVWRQLWRVLEMSDILLLVMDIRNPLIHFPVPLYDYVTKVLKRKMIGIFNKVDLVSEFTVFAWTKYFEEMYPDLHVTTFSCFARDTKLIDDTKSYALKTKVKRPKKRKYSAQGVRDILRCCQSIGGKDGVVTDWDALVEKYSDTIHENNEDDDNDSDTGSMLGLEDQFCHVMDVKDEQVSPHKDYLTLGLVGQPNVGKSTIINSIMQRTVVSTSQTPGHTKHFQTIYLCDNVRLCDSPGLVFPSLLPRSLQILTGMYPIAQVQEPYSTVQYLCQRLPLEDILSLSPPYLDEYDKFKWSAWLVCEAYAEQRGFHVAKAAGPDAYRAANAILRLACDGRILLSFKPPGFFNTTKYEKCRVLETDLQQTEQGSDTDNSNQITDSESENCQGTFETTKSIFSVLADLDTDI
ncbi:P-loop containing nucleoside triphosphate hydrolase protein [Hesseltinella vesiculosa]|uniref:Guanine nucleotide-binding protein-like 1 n=1 Tax=Hesseltinella vesiculosa TaxID=101127 RepID=A0A1X2GKL6_9FUNG|nr:P-loop containing nucleoside triphosphate hydrolase protein [Hesseltinella vesiculosa]